MKKIILISVWCALVIPIYAFSNSHAAENGTLSALLDLLPGTFDSGAQMRDEKSAGGEGAVIHGWVYRTFTKIDAPDVGEHVFVGTVRYNGENGYFDKAEFQVWTLQLADDKGGVIMSPMRFLDPDTNIAKIGIANAFDGLQGRDLGEPAGSAGCDIHWRMEDGVLRGMTDPEACRWMSSVEKIELAWDWQYELKRDAMWIKLAGRNDAGDILSGPKDNSPFRLDRLQ